MKLPPFGQLARSILGVSVLGLPLLLAAAEVKTVNASAEQTDELLAGKKTNTYIIVSKGEVIDMDGRHFAPGKAKAFLKKAKPDKKAAYVFLIPDDTLLDTARSMVGAFGDYGATVFVVRKMPKGGITVSAPADGAAAKPDQRTLKLVGAPNPEASSARDAPPPMAGRPQHLQPGKLPSRVRYKFVADEAVVMAAALTEKLLLSAEPADAGAHFETMVMVNPGAWRHVSDLPELKGTKPMIAQVEMGAKVLKMEGRLLGEANQLVKSVDRIRELLAADGGGTVRALTSAEMNHWWTFIGFDIEEPVFAIESKRGKYVFIIGWLRKQVFCLDELKALPTR